MYNSITGIILSGGKSSRMGVNKSLLKFSDKYNIELIKDLMVNVFERVILITNEPELYEFLELETYPDIYLGYGPLGGIHSGLIHSETESNFIISCDMPFIDKNTIEFIVNYPSKQNIIVPKSDGFIQQLCGIYKKSLIPAIGKILNQGGENENRNSIQTKRKCKVHQIIEETDSTIIDMESEYPLYHKDLFFNMNSLDDYRYVLDKLE
jgi:molybdopterin-guanine dinucleotide biosynthesis protein A